MEQIGNFYGCDSTDRAQVNCSSALTNEAFHWQGSNYSIATLFRDDNNRQLVMKVSRNNSVLSGSQAKTALGSLMLNVGGTAFFVSDTITLSDQILWSYVGYRTDKRATRDSWQRALSGWRDGQRVTVRLTDTASGVRAIPGDGLAGLQWDNPNFPGPGVRKHHWEYQQRAGSGAWSAWKDIPGMWGEDVLNRSPYEATVVTGLQNGTAYSFRIRGYQGQHRGVVAVQGATTTPVTPSANTASVRLRPTGPAGNQLTLEWTPVAATVVDVPGASGGYRIAWKKATEDWDSAEVFSVSYSIMSHVFPGLVAGTEYTARVWWDNVNRRHPDPNKLLGEAKGTPGAVSSGQSQRGTPGAALPPDDQSQPVPPAEPPDNNQQGQRGEPEAVGPPDNGQPAQPNAPETTSPPDDPPSEPDRDAPVTRTGTNGRDDLEGGGGDDLLIGLRGGDVLRGKGGHDELRGGRGNDELVGGKGDDTLTGGRGADRFVFSPRESGEKIITDFDAGEGDTIVLRANRQPSIADIVATGVAQGSRYMVYTLFPGLTVETDVTLRTEDFRVE